ncbi:MAG: MFS transporter [Actinomycetota bacterium]|nr:MFS transporter [Actinomycetota bacterium]
MAVYLLAVLHRTSLGVAGALAEHRFGITPAQLSVFIFLQLGIYAAMQVPAGVLVDRYGPRRLLVTASVLMGVAQLAFATVPSYPAALAARALLGCGDALTFISVLRLVATHFSPRRFPLLVTITSMVGTIGNVLATLPLALVLRSAGWSAAFAPVAALSLVVGAAAWLLIPDTTAPPRPLRTVRALRLGVTGVAHRVRVSWAQPGTRLGFWVHFSTMSAGTAYGVLWGGTYLVKGAGFSTAAAGGVLMTGVVAAAAASPLFGAAIGRRPILRVPIALAACAGSLSGWLVLICGFGDRPPKPLVVVVFVVMTLGAPVSTAAFALARDYNGARTLGTASGVVNVGGFLATIVIAVGIGWVLDLMGTTDRHTLRMAALVAVGVQAFGAVRMAIWLRRQRAHSLLRQARGEATPVTVVRRRWDLRIPVPVLDEIGLAAAQDTQQGPPTQG